MRRSEKAGSVPFNDAAEAKREGKKVKLRDDWGTVKVGILREVLRAKFIGNPHLAAKLRDTFEDFEELLIRNGYVDLSDKKHDSAIQQKG